jgi:hypothetical protein
MNMDLAVLDVWLDGEAVPRDQVTALLATDEGRAYAIDVMALRRVMQIDAPMQAHPRPSRWRPLVAAAAILLTTAGGFVAGQYASRSNDDAAEAVTTVSTSAPAPAPTRVIQFEVGVDWNETSGGN